VRTLRARSPSPARSGRDGHSVRVARRPWRTVAYRRCVHRAVPAAARGDFMLSGLRPRAHTLILVAHRSYAARMSRPPAKTRLFVPGPLASGTAIALPDDAAHHLARVLRAREGDPVTLFDGTGGEYAATIASLDRRRVSVTVGPFDPIEREAPVETTLCQALAKGTKMDFVVQKATELGVSRVVPFVATRSNVKLDADKSAERAAHWRRVAIAACEQCGRNRPPEVTAIALAADLPRILGDGRVAFAAPGAERHLARLCADSPTVPLSVVVGPEGGLTDDEHDVLVTAGFTPVSLGPRVLRTETAGIAALATIEAVRATTRRDD